MQTPMTREAREAREAQQRERHRQDMAQKRAAAKATLEALRRELYELLDQRQVSLAAHWDRQCQLQRPQQSTSPTTVGGPLKSEETMESGEEMPSLVDEYTRAVELENALHIEHVNLEKRLTKYDIFESWLHRDVPQLEQANAERMEQSGLQQRREDDHDGSWKRFTEDEKPFYYVPVTAAKCHEFVRAHYPSFLSHHAAFAQQAQVLGTVPFFGWGVQRSTLNGHHFHFSKWVPCTDSAVQSANFIVDEAWKILNTPEFYENLFHARVTMGVLQRVDTDITVIVHNLPAADNSATRRCILLASKIVDRDEDGREIVGIVLHPPHEEMVKQHFPGIQFTCKVSTYLLLHHRMNDRGEEFVEMSLGGYGGHPSEAQADFVFLELAHALFRFEQRVLPHNLVSAE